MKILYIALAVMLILFLLFGAFAFRYRRPYRKTVVEYSSCPSLAFSVMKAESGFQERALSEAGAVGLMQLMPDTAKFVCDRAGISFDANRLTEGKYNAMLGCIYLDYLLLRFQNEKETALAAYNAGEGVVSLWLKNSDYSDDGIRLKYIPYAETRSYVKKVLKYQKIYSIFD